MSKDLPMQFRNTGLVCCTSLYDKITVYNKHGINIFLKMLQ